eukprot:gene7045-11208_t
MSSKNIQVEEEKNFDCTLCLDVIIEPTTLTCHHSFCHFCLYQLLELNYKNRKHLNIDESNQEKIKINCPLCRKENILNLKNLKINKMLEQEIKTKFTQQYETRKIEIEKEWKVFKSKKYHHGKLIIGNFHQYKNSETSNCHHWKFFVRQESLEENIIEQVIVKLHPTFMPNEITLKNEPFEISRLGWGTFNIQAIILFKSKFKKQPVRLNHYLSFDGNGDFSEFDVDLEEIKN